MKTVNIMTMTPDEILVRAAFKRAVPSANANQMGVNLHIGNAAAIAPDESFDAVQYELYTQGDFIREFEVNAHLINSLKYLPNPLLRDSDNKLYQKIKSRVAIPFEARIWNKRVATLTGNNVDLRIINSDAGKDKVRLLSIFREGWEDKNMENAVYELICSDGKTGDGAICFFMSEKQIGWRSFGYEKGDVLYPHYDPSTGELGLFGRRYVMAGPDDVQTTYLDVWDKTYYCRYVYSEDAHDGGKLKWQVDEPAKPHGFPFIPVVYSRYGEPFWANSENLIRAYENAVSQFCENNAAYALRILYAFGAELEMSSTLDGTPTQINASTTDAKVGFLEPADASRSFELQLDKLEKNIMKSSFAVETPEIKSGADMSSLTVKMLFADSYQKAVNDAQFYQKTLDNIVRIFKWGLGLELQKSSQFEALKIKAEIFPYIFMSETEEAANTVQFVGVGALSKKSASEKAYSLGYGVVSEYDRILQEEHDSLLGQQTAASVMQNNAVNAARKTAARKKKQDQE